MTVSRRELLAPADIKRLNQMNALDDMPWECPARLRLWS
jgi:hypothetical protein